VIRGIGYQFSNGQKIVRVERVVLATARNYFSTPLETSRSRRASLRSYNIGVTQHPLSR